MSVLDTLVARLAARQQGVAAHWQLTALGLSASSIDRRVADGRLRRLHRGVYAVGALDRRGHWMAAVLACGERALLSHRDAAMLWDLRQSDRRAIDVTAVGARRRRRPRLTIHSAAALHPDDRDEFDGIPVTSVPRTLLDLAEVVAPTQLRRAYEAAERHGLLDVRAVSELLKRSNGRRGMPALFALLDYDPREALDSKSDLESRFLDLVREAGLPLPQINVLVEGFLVDAYWPAARLVVELQSYQHHAHRQAFDRDYAKLGGLTMSGYRVLPLTARQLRDDAGWILGAVRSLIGAPSAQVVPLRSAAPAPTL